jgi:hypothetical protein
MGKGGGGSAPQPSSQTVTQTNLPEYARPYFEDLLKRGQTTSQVEYQPFGGQRTAPFTPLQQQAFQGIGSLQPSQAVGAGIDVSANVAQQAGQYGGYQPLQAQNLFQAPRLQQTRISTPTVGTGSFADTGVAGQYMSPYMQNVVDIQQREAQRQADIARTQRGAQAASAGAFGGSRQAILEAEAARNLATQKGDIQAQGLQSAYQQAQQAYQTDAQRQLAAQQANQAANLQAQGLGLNQIQALNQARMQAAQLGAQYGLSGLQAAEQSRQFGAGLGLQGLQQQLAAAGQLGALGQTQYGQQLGSLQAQQQAGAAQQAQAQQQLDQQYEEFMRQQFYPQTQLQFYSSLLRGVPVSPQQTMYSYQAPPNPVSQIAGLGLGIGALSKAFAEGGEVQMAEGGASDAGLGRFDSKISQYTKEALLVRNDPQRLNQLLQRLGPLERALVAERVQQASGRLQNEAAMARGEPQGTVLEGEYSRMPESGLASIPANINAMAGGGIIAFNGGGSPPPDYHLDDDPVDRGAAGDAEDVKGKGAKGESRFSKLRKAVQPERFNPDLKIPMPSAQGIGSFAKGAARLAGKASGPFAAIGAANTAVDLYNTPTEDIRRFYGAQTEEPSFLGDVYYRGRAALDDLIPFRTSPIGVIREKQAAEAAARATSPQGPTTTAPAETSVKAPVEPPKLVEGPRAAPTGLKIPGARKPTDEDALLSEAEGYLRDIMKGRTPEEQAASDQKTREEFGQRRQAMYKERGIDPDLYKKELTSIFQQGESALKNKDMDRALAMAEGFFTMAAGSSPYLFQNAAQGLGVSVKNLRQAEKDFRESELQRQKAAMSVRLAEKAAADGDFKAEEDYVTRAREFEQRSLDNKLKVVSTLYAGRLKTKEFATFKGISAARAQEAAAEAKRRNLEMEQNARNARVQAELTRLNTEEKNLLTSTIAGMNYGAIKDAAGLEKFTKNPANQEFLTGLNTIRQSRQQLLRQLGSVYGTMSPEQEAQLAAISKKYSR